MVTSTLPHPRTAFALPRGRGDFVRQLALCLAFVGAYQAARGLADRGAAEALANGRAVVRIERHLHAFFEPHLQRPVVETGGLLLHAVDWTYWLSQLAVVALALLWVYLRHNESYVRVRNALFVANTIGLLGYIVLPTAPPRFFPALGFTDTLARSEALSHATGLVRIFSNPFAAMPSLHAADALIVGLALAGTTRARLPKVVFLLWPAWVSFSLIATANHFWLDILVGLVLAAAGMWAARVHPFGQLPMHRARPARIIREDKEVANVSVHVEAARIPDRNRLLRELRLAGLDARPVGEIAIEVPYDGDPENVSDELFSHAEDVIMSIGAPFVPIKHDGVIYIRPPLS